MVKTSVATIARDTGQLERADPLSGDGHATIGKACSVLLRNGWDIVSRLSGFKQSSKS